MKNVLIIGASAWQVPAILKAKEMGYRVAVADYNPKAIGIKYADKFYEVSTIDSDGIFEAARDFHADGITTVATDMPMNAIAYATTELGLCGISPLTAKRSTDKYQMIEAFEAAGVPHPWFKLVVAGESVDPLDFKYPVICKPIDNSASRGVMKVDRPSDLLGAIEYSSGEGRSGNVLIEECMEGPEVSVECFAIDEVRRVVAITDKLTTGAPHFVELGHSQPSALPEKAKEDIERVALAAMKAVGIDDGPAHVEVMYTGEGAKIVELGARLGGDFITTDLVPLSTGVDILGATIAHACGDRVELNSTITQGSAVRYVVGAVGRIESFRKLDVVSQMPGVQRVEMLKNVGDVVGDIDNSLDRTGYVIATGSTSREASNRAEFAASQIEVVVGLD